MRELNHKEVEAVAGGLSPILAWIGQTLIDLGNAINAASA